MTHARLTGSPHVAPSAKLKRLRSQHSSHLARSTGSAPISTASISTFSMSTRPVG